MTHTIGSDPEFFLRNKKDNKLISAVGILNGTKNNPQILESGGGLHYDNVALEFSTKPQKNGNAFVDHLIKVFKDVHGVLPEDLEIMHTPAADFDDDQLQTDEAKAFGCSPDYDAWSISVNEPPVAKNMSMRSCGGHIHVGFVKGSGNNFLLDPFGKIRTVKAMDLFHGIISVVLDNSEDAIRRRDLYGKAGCHRPTDYGVEYRVLSNYWFKSATLVMLMNSLVDDVLKAIRNNVDETLINTIGENTIKDTINTGDATTAKNIIESYLMKHLSNDSIFFLTESLNNIDNYNFNEEWGV